MEYNSFGPNSYETSDEGSDDTNKKSQKSKQKPQKARFLDITATEKDQTDDSDNKPSVFEFKNKKAEQDREPATVAETDADAAMVEAIDGEEHQHAAEVVAAEHLQAMDLVAEPAIEQLVPAHDFLERVEQGEDVEAAFQTAAANNDLQAEHIEAAVHEIAVNDAEALAAQTPPEAHEAGVIDPAAAAEGEIAWRNETLRPAPAAQTQRPNILPAAANSYYVHRHQSHDFIAGAAVGGAVGYLMGRRRGRIKTEKKLQPLQAKLEQQVTLLERDITRKEQALVLAKSKQRAAEARAALPTSRQETRTFVASERTQPGRQETRLGLEKPIRAERLGHMVVAAEAPAAAERARTERANTIRSAFRPEEVKSMHRNDLLELSEKIMVEGASLRRIYESRLIGEKQLRHLVTEYLQGKDITRDLRREMVEHEIDFERDPILRDRVRSHLTNNGNGGGLGELLESVGIVEHEADPALDHRVAADTARKAKAQHRHDRQRVVADTAMVTAIVVLTAVIVILVMRG